MRNLFTRSGLRFTLYLLITACLFFAGGINKASGQCAYIAGESTTGFTPTCSQQNTSGPGAGAYRYYTVPLIAGEWYMYQIQAGAGTTLTCAEPYYPANGAWGASCLNTWSYLQSPTTTSAVNDFLIETARSGGWNGNSSVLYYQEVVPGAPSWSSAPNPVCINTAATYTINVPSYASYYNWAVTGGTINSGQ